LFQSYKLIEYSKFAFSKIDFVLLVLILEWIDLLSKLIERSLYIVRYVLFKQCMKINDKCYKKKIIKSRLKIKKSKKAHLNTDNIHTFNFNIIGQFTIILKLINDA